MTVVATAILCSGPGAAVCGFLVAGLSSAFQSGVTGGKLGDILKAGLIATVTAVAFNVVGGITNAIAGEPFSGRHIQPEFGTNAYALNVAGHAAVGCLSSVASGGKCESGAISAGAGAAAAPLVNVVSRGSFIGGAAASGVVGGLASVAGGGKFANGAATAAFGYMYNQCGGDPVGCGLVGRSASDAYSSAQGQSAISELQSFLSEKLVATFYAGYGGELTPGSGGAAAVGLYIDTKGNYGVFGQIATTNGFSGGEDSWFAGVQRGGVDSFRGWGNNTQANTPLGGAAVSWDSNSVIGAQINNPGASVSTGRTLTCTWGVGSKGC